MKILMKTVASNCDWQANDAGYFIWNYHDDQTIVSHKDNITMNVAYPGSGLAPNRRQAITWNNADPVHWHLYAALGDV